jgi:2-iminobutanoate/2-iminopropanoate deaminase
VPAAAGTIGHLVPNGALMSAADRAWAPVPAASEAVRPAGHYSSAVRAGPFVFVAGMTPRDPLTGDVGPDDARVHARRCLVNLRNALAACGARMDDVVSTLVHVARTDDWGAINEVWPEFFTAPYPTRTVVGATLRGGMLVEITATAYLGDAARG